MEDTNTVTENDVNEAAIFGGEDDTVGDGEQTSDQSQAAAPTQDSADTFITDEEFNRLSSNPAELRRIARERHEAALKQHADVIEFKRAYDADPVAVVTNLAKRLGVLKDQPTPADVQRTQEPSFAEATYARLNKVLGPQLAGEMTQILIDTAKAMADQAVAPIRQGVHQQSQAAAQAEATRIVSSYFEKNPDAVAHQETMFKLMNKYVPGPEMTDEEWLDLLHEKAVSLNTPKQVADGRKIAAGLVKSTVQQIRGASPAQLVTKVPKVEGKVKGGAASELKRLAFEAATRGERWDSN